MDIGFELPNRAQVYGEEWDRLRMFGASAVKARAYHLVGPYNRENVQEIQRLARMRPGQSFTVMVRPAGDGHGWSPAERINELAASVRALTFPTNEFGHLYVIPDNEPNHPSHGVDPTPEYWQQVREVASGLRRLCPGVLIATPPLAVGHAEVAWYQACGPDMPFDAVAVHLYGQLDSGLAGATLANARRFAMAQALPLIADEVGDSHPTAGWDQKARSVAGLLQMAQQNDCDAATIFILGGTPEWSGFVPDSTAMVQIRDIYRGAVPEALPMPDNETGIQYAGMTATIIAPPSVRQNTMLGVKIIRPDTRPYQVNGGFVMLDYPQKNESADWERDIPVPFAFGPDGVANVTIDVGDVPGMDLPDAGIDATIRLIPAIGFIPGNFTQFANLTGEAPIRVYPPDNSVLVQQPKPPAPIAPQAPKPGPGSAGFDWEASPSLGLWSAFYNAAHALELSRDPYDQLAGTLAVQMVDAWKGNRTSPFGPRQR